MADNSPPNPFTSLAAAIHAMALFNGGVWFIPDQLGRVRVMTSYKLCQCPIMEPANDS